jgi:capsular polysaccharide transport system permease protein
MLDKNTNITARRARRNAILNPIRWSRSILLIVIFPTILASFYYGFIATPRYVSEAKIIIESDGNTAVAGALASMLSSLGGLSGGGAAVGQAHMMAEYIKSPAMLNHLQRDLNIKAIYSPPEADYLSRLKPNPTDEEFFDYYSRAVEVELDTISHILTVRAEAFAPSDAHLIVTYILSRSEELLNTVLKRKEEDTVAFAKREVREAEERLMRARFAVAEFRRMNADIDPIRTASSQGGLIANLAGQLSEAQAELSSSLVFFKPESTQIRALQAKIAGLEKQIVQEQRRLVADNSGTIGERLLRYEELLLEQEFSQNAYTSALTFLESSRISSQKRRNYVVDFVEPNTPDQPTRPEKLKAILTVFVISFLIWGVGSLLLTAIRESGRA